MFTTSVFPLCHTIQFIASHPIFVVNDVNKARNMSPPARWVQGLDSSVIWYKKPFNSFKPGVPFVGHSPRWGAAKRGVPSGAILFA